MPADRIAAGKPERGRPCCRPITSAGALQIVVADDGRGIDLERPVANGEARFVHRRDGGLNSANPSCCTLLRLRLHHEGPGDGHLRARRLTSHDVVKEVRGLVRIASEYGKGTRFVLQLPLISRHSTPLVEIAGEVYAFPFARIARAIKLPKDRIEVLGGRQHFDLEGRQIGIVTAHQVLGTAPPDSAGGELAIVVVGDDDSYGLVVDRFIGGRVSMSRRSTRGFENSRTSAPPRSWRTARPC